MGDHPISSPPPPPPPPPPPHSPSPPPASCGVRLDGPTSGPIFAMVVVFIATLLALRAMGRVVQCACGTIQPIVLDAWSSHTSQHLLDPYSPSHFSHGLIFYFVLGYALRLLPRSRPDTLSPPRWRDSLRITWPFVLAMLLEAAWEIFENTPFVIDRYRSVTASLDYSGDSVINSFGDMLSCFLGYAVARRLGLFKTTLLFLALELATLAWIRDNLTLNVVMLIHPIDAVKQWQMP